MEATPSPTSAASSSLPTRLPHGVVGDAAPQHEVDVGLGLDDGELGPEVRDRGHRRKRGARHVHDAGDATGRCGSGPGFEVLPVREAGVVEVDVAVDHSRNDQAPARGRSPRRRSPRVLSPGSVTSAILPSTIRISRGGRRVAAGGDPEVGQPLSHRIASLDLPGSPDWVLPSGTLKSQAVFIRHSRRCRRRGRPCRPEPPPPAAAPTPLDGHLLGRQPGTVVRMSSLESMLRPSRRARQEFSVPEEPIGARRSRIGPGSGRTVPSPGRGRPPRGSRARSWSTRCTLLRRPRSDGRWPMTKPSPSASGRLPVRSGESRSVATVTGVVS